MPAPILTIEETIEVGNVSIYLAANDNSKGSLFGPRLAAPGSPVTIAMVTDALTWGYNGGAQSSEDVRSMANYLIWLCGMYGQQAQYILLVGGGGSITPINPPVIPPAPLPYQFFVSGSSFIITGQNSKTITDFIGYNLLFSRGGIPQSTIATEPSWYFWTKETGEFFISPAAVVGELFQIYAI